MMTESVPCSNHKRYEDIYEMFLVYLFWCRQMAMPSYVQDTIVVIVSIVKERLSIQLYGYMKTVII